MNTVFELAIKEKNNKLLIVALDNGVSPNEVYNFKNWYFTTLTAEQLRILLCYGFDCNRPDDQGRTLFRYCCINLENNFSVLEIENLIVDYGFWKEEESTLEEYTEEWTSLIKIGKQFMDKIMILLVAKCKIHQDDINFLKKDSCNYELLKLAERVYKDQ